MQRTGSAVFKVGDLARVLDTKPRQVEGWIEQGFLKPAVRGKGPGRWRRFRAEHVLLGALLLEVQAAFGEKSPLCSRLLPTVEKAVMDYWKAGDLSNRFEGRPEEVLLAVTQEAGKVADTAVLNASDLGAYTLRQKPAGVTAVFNLSAIARSVRERISP